MSDWRETQLSRIAKLRSGFPFKSSSWVDDGVPVIKIANIKDGRIVADGCGYVSHETATTAQEWMTQKGDILIAMTGYVGEIARVRPGEKYLINQRVGRFDFLDDAPVIPEFFFYYLRQLEVRSLLETMARGSAQPNLSANDVAKLRVPVPPLPEQSTIAHILSTLDDKIELNRRQNETLEAMARALFKAWFVDFEPVRAKLEGRWQRGQSLPGLPAHLYDLFPDRLVDSELGEIPEGWEIGRVSNFLSLAYGKSLPAGIRNSGVIPVYGSGGITGHHDTALVDSETVIVGRKGTVGSLYWEQLPCFPIDTVFYVQPKVALPFCYHLLASLPLGDMNTDAAVPGLNRENVYRLDVISPNQTLIDNFSAIARDLRDQIFCFQNESRTLAQLRDTLLPKLISGELRIKDAEAFLKERG
jgi:type I restriction enzyme S subunit